MSWAAALSIARRFWWAVPMIALAIALFVTRGRLADRTATLQAERDAWTATIARADQVRIETERRYAQQAADAATTFADRIASREPIILRSTNTVREYAQTDPGRVLCRAADRVHAIDALDAELAAGAGTASRGAGGVRPDATATPAGR